MTHLNKAAETPFPLRFQAFAYRKKADRIFFESGLLFCVFQSLIEANASDPNFEDKWGEEFEYQSLIEVNASGSKGRNININQAGINPL